MSETKEMKSLEDSSPLASLAPLASSHFGKVIEFECMDGNVKTVMDEHMSRFDVLMTWLSSPMRTEQSAKLATFFLDYTTRDVLDWIYDSKNRKWCVEELRREHVCRVIKDLDQFLQKDFNAKEECKQFILQTAQKFAKYWGSTPLSERVFLAPWIEREIPEEIEADIAKAYNIPTHLATPGGEIGTICTQVSRVQLSKGSQSFRFWTGSKGKVVFTHSASFDAVYC